ncbi:MAG: fibrobacter succinogenes major paralogous domain-containing protein, partial [Prevotellaceae bacterium]|nr:fibrobacter succinogenes major paralogous domain-containing protein [Prevotellaceae bacterium]
NTLWGNGQLINYNFGSDDGGAVPGSGGYYQKPVKTVNDPCPLGWRIPTQDEWERLCDYGCNAPQTAGGDFLILETEYYKSLSTLTNGNTNAPLTWVRVENGLASTDTWATGDRSGYAVYKTADWEAAIGVSGYFDNGGNPDYTRPLYAATAPEPLLFLPAEGFHYRENGSFAYTGYSGHYWSSTVTDISTRYPNFEDGHCLTSVYTYGRANGFGVRCVAE